ncbi:hypothetical protein [Streptomyces sp. NPDC087300]|uniref:hypothetical protein n=1 Tax=Streptomyces sp. NPDC087300 TaxID=3365780 RepID=UPI0038300635
MDVPSTAATAAVDGGALLAFGPGVSAQHRTDASYALLLAQLVANRKFNRFAATEHWYGVFGETLQSLGWIVKDHEGFVRHRPRAFPYRIDSLVLAALRPPLVDDAGSNVLSDALKALAGLPDGERAVELFDEYGQFEESGNFQVALVEEADALVAVRLGRFRFRVADEETARGRLPRTDFHAGDVFHRGAQTLHLNEEVYGPLRDDIAAKLGDRVGVLIAPVT